MKKENTFIFLADFTHKRKEEYNIIEKIDFTVDALNFMQNCITLAKQKRAVIDIAFSHENISAELVLPNGIFDKEKSNFLATLILSSSTFLILAPPIKSNQNFKVRFNFEIKKH